MDALMAGALLCEEHEEVQHELTQLLASLLTLLPQLRRLQFLVCSHPPPSMNSDSSSRSLLMSTGMKAAWVLKPNACLSSDLHHSILKCSSSCASLTLYSSTI